MNNTLFLVIFGIATLYFGLQTKRILPTVLRLLGALRTGAAKWPGPRIHDPNPSASRVRERLGVGYQHLFSTFMGNSLAVMGALIFSLLSFISHTTFMSGYIRFTGTGSLLFLILIVLTGGVFATARALDNVVKVRTVLHDLENKVEPRSVEGHSAEAEFAIEHPLIGQKVLRSDRKRAMDLFYESAGCHQDGNEQRAFILYQEAMRTDPSLHDNARAVLSKMSQDCTSNNEGAIYYWLGIHSEYLMDWKQAAVYYDKSINAFSQLGHQKRESRVHCNLGTVKMRMGDPAGMEEFENSIALNPGNGTAHINIGRTYYRVGYPGDSHYERALDAFADAIVANPQTYGPIVISSLQQIGYTWKEDLEEITRRVEKKQHEISSR